MGREQSWTEWVLSTNAVGIAGSFCLLASPFVGWIAPPLERSIAGYLIPIVYHEPSGGARFTLFSIGGAIFGLGLFGLLSFSLKRPWIRFIVAGTALLTCLVAVYKMAIWNPGWVWDLLDQNDQYQGIIKFTTAYLPTNMGVEPSFWAGLTADSVIERLIASWYFLSRGWYFSVFGGLLQLLSLFWDPLFRSLKKDVLVILTVTMVSLAIIPLLPAFLSEYHLSRADQFRFEGLHTLALDHYHKAQGYDPGLDYSDSYHRRLGAVYEALERKDAPDFHLYQGDRFRDQRNEPAAVFEYQQAALQGSNLLRKVAQNRLGRLYIQYGLKSYAEDVPGTAISEWGKAVETDPAQIQAYYYLAKAHFDLGQYPEAIMENERFLRRSVDPLLNANVYSNLGDCYMKLKMFAKARDYYRLSLTHDSSENYRALKGLVGS